jgi:protein TonB
MTKLPSPFLQHLGLEDDADERAIRRSYARLLKQIDQESAPQEFQALREAYEKALQWAHYRQQHVEAATAAQDDRSGQGVAGDAAVLRHALVDAETTARAVLGELVERLKSHPPADLREGRKLLDETLEDPRLLDLDAQFLFEWGIASILAQGWRPGHEYLFGPAMACFRWREDRTRLRRLGNAGQFIDQAIGEVDVYDGQPDTLRTPQRDLIRRLRSDARPSDRVLIQALPLAEKLVAVWPNWLHVVTDTQNILKWRQWDAKVPRWRRAVTGKPHGSMASGVKAGRSHGEYFFLALLVVICVVGLFAPDRKPAPKAPQQQQQTASFPPLATGSTYGRPLPPSVPSAFAPPVQTTPAPPALAPVPPPLADLNVAKKTATTLAKGKVVKQKCEDAAAVMRLHMPEHEKGFFGPSFDRLVMDCLVKKLWSLPAPVPYPAIEASFKRDQKRLQREMEKSFLEVRPLTLSPPPPAKPSPVLSDPTQRSNVWLVPPRPSPGYQAPAAPSLSMDPTAK